MKRLSMPSLFLVLVTSCACAGTDGARGPEGEEGAEGLPGQPGTAATVTSAVDHLTSLAGLPLTTALASSLTPVPAGMTTRRVLVLNAVLRADGSTSSPIIGVFQGHIDPIPVAGAHEITIWDPSTGAEFPGSGLEIVHVDVLSYFSP